MEHKDELPPPAASDEAPGLKEEDSIKSVDLALEILTLLTDQKKVTQEPSEAGIRYKFVPEYAQQAKEYPSKIKELINQGDERNNHFNVNPLRYLNYIDGQRKKWPSFFLSYVQYQRLEQIANPEAYPDPLFDLSKAATDVFIAHYYKGPYDIRNLLLKAINDGNREVLTAKFAELPAGSDITEFCKAAITKNQIHLLLFLLSSEKHQLDKQSLLFEAIKNDRSICLLSLRDLGSQLDVGFIQNPNNKRALERIAKSENLELIWDLKSVSEDKAWFAFWEQMPPKVQANFIKHYCRTLEFQHIEMDPKVLKDRVSPVLAYLKNHNYHPMLVQIRKYIETAPNDPSVVLGCLSLAKEHFANNATVQKELNDWIQKINDPVEQAHRYYEQIVKKMNANDEGVLSASDAKKLSDAIRVIRSAKPEAKAAQPSVKPGFFAGLKAWAMGAATALPSQPSLIRMRITQGVYLLYSPITEKFIADNSVLDLQAKLPDWTKDFDKQAPQYKRDQSRLQTPIYYNQAVTADVLVRSINMQDEIPDTRLYQTPAALAAKKIEEIADPAEVHPANIAFIQYDLFALPAILNAMGFNGVLTYLNARNQNAAGGHFGQHAQEEIAVRTTTLLLSYLRQSMQTLLNQGGSLYVPPGQPESGCIANLPELTQHVASITKDVLCINRAVTLPTHHLNYVKYLAIQNPNIKVHVIGNACINLNLYPGKTTADFVEGLKPRIEAQLLAAVDSGTDVLVLIPWGCGVFANDPAVIGRWYAEMIVKQDIDKKIGTILFDVLDPGTYAVFKDAFMQEYKRLRPHTALQPGTLAYLLVQTLATHIKSERSIEDMLVHKESKEVAKELPVVKSALELTEEHYEAMVNKINAFTRDDALSPEEAAALSKSIETITEAEKEAKQQEGPFKRKERSLIRMYLTHDRRLGQNIYILYDPIKKQYVPDESLIALQQTLPARTTLFNSAQEKEKYNRNKPMPKAPKSYYLAVMADILIRSIETQRDIPNTTIFDTASRAEYDLSEEKAEELSEAELDPNLPHAANVVFMQHDMLALPALLHQIGYGADITLLNAMNEWAIGGGFFIGSHAQEEMLCRTTNLSLSLLRKSMEAFLREGGKLYASRHGEPAQLPHFKDTQAAITEALGFINTATIAQGYHWNRVEYRHAESVLKCNLVGNASINLSPWHNHYPGKTTQDFEVTVKNRMSAHLLASVKCNSKVLVLTAFGCGAFSNDPKLIGKWYAEVIVKHNIDKKVGTIMFSILGDETYSALKEAFVAEYTRLRQNVTVQLNSDTYQLMNKLEQHLRKKEPLTERFVCGDSAKAYHPEPPAAAAVL